ncbi:MAG: hypothetical protein MJZ62_07540 [Bacteroidales bacterium]|nr:hypothetical protein [Bacteroidales bacterium]
MFLREIEDFENRFTMLDRLNTLVFNVWDDKAATAFKNANITQIETLYRSYISEMRSLSEEANMLKQRILEDLKEAERLSNEIQDISHHPKIAGCYSVEVTSETEHNGTTFEHHTAFAIGPNDLTDKDSLIDMALSRADVDGDIIDVSLGRSL